MRKLLHNLIMLVILGALAYYFLPEIKTSVSYLKKKYLPCTSPVYYSLGTIDERFGISKEEFLKDINLAEGIWEDPSSLNLFEYKEDANFKVNLIYDSRQETTEKLQEVGGTLTTGQKEYNAKKAEYEILHTSYTKKRALLDARIKALEERQKSYNQQVESWNKKGGAPENVFNELEAERVSINKEVEAIRIEQEKLNQEVVKINAMVAELNSMAKNLNLHVAQYNQIGSSQGEEFDEGIYHIGSEGEWIDIYQFDNKNQLVRVLAHELGHSLGIDHVEDPEAIMYRLNTGKSNKLSEADFNALKALCKI